MKTKIWTGLLCVALCLLLTLASACAVTREGVIFLEGMAESITETLYESEWGYSFWYPKGRLDAYPSSVGIMDGDMIEAPFSGDHMFLSLVDEEDAQEYGEELDLDVVGLSAVTRVMVDVYRVLEDGRYYFLTLIAENGHYCIAVGEYIPESAEGNAKYFQRILESFTFFSEYDDAMKRELPGQWTEEYEGAGTVLMLEENGGMILHCYSTDGKTSYSCQGAWSYEPVPDYSGRLRLQFTSTTNPAYAGKAYSVACVYEAYTESWVEDDTEYTYLILNPLVSSTGVTPFREVYGEDDVSLHREKGPNMRVVKCKEYVSLREERSTSARRLVKVPLGALVLAYPEYGEENGFIYCVYHGEEGYILAEYLTPVN